MLIYNWAHNFPLGILIDHLTMQLLVLIGTIAILVNIYSISYMRQEPGYRRFFCYMTLFTLFMIILVLADNFLLLLFGWEGISLFSTLLISFYIDKKSAVKAGFKAFIVNRIGDVALILGIAAIYHNYGSLSYSVVFAHASRATATLPCILLLIGALAKAAQLPLHIWLPDAMEAPIPTSALIHAATMVIAGIYMLLRLAPLYALAPLAQSIMLIIGSTTALLMALTALWQVDIKKILVYSTISQLGYMVAMPTMGHLLTHSYAKALLFLAAGGVILGQKGEQDIRKMGGLRKYLPLAYLAFLIGSLVLSLAPSKGVILQRLWTNHNFGATYAYVCLLITVFLTSLYLFRAFFVVFHGKENHLLSSSGLTGGSRISVIILMGISLIFIVPFNFTHFDFYLALLGIIVAWKLPMLPYWHWRSYDYYLAVGFKKLASCLNKIVEINLVDNFSLNGSSKIAVYCGVLLQRVQNNSLLQYLLWMVLGVIVGIIVWFLGY